MLKDAGKPHYRLVNNDVLVDELRIAAVSAHVSVHTGFRLLQAYAQLHRAAVLYELRKAKMTAIVEYSDYDNVDAVFVGCIDKACF